MNFLLHWYVARRELDDPAAAAASMLPDVWRMADRAVRAQRGVASDRPGLASVLGGIAHHLEVDRWFHQAPIFVDGERLVASALRASGSTAPKLGLFAHITWEMLLDGALLRREGLEATLTVLRADIDAMRAHAEEAAELHHFGKAPARAAARPLFDRRVERLLEAIAEGPWIAGYRDGAGIVERMEGVRRRFALAPFEDEERRALAASLEALAPAASEALLDPRVTRG